MPAKPEPKIKMPAGSGIPVMPPPVGSTGSLAPNESSTVVWENVNGLVPAPITAKDNVPNEKLAGCRGSSSADGSSDTAAKSTNPGMNARDVNTSKASGLPRNAENVKAVGERIAPSKLTPMSNAPTAGGGVSPARKISTVTDWPICADCTEGMKDREIGFARRKLQRVTKILKRVSVFTVIPTFGPKPVAQRQYPPACQLGRQKDPDFKPKAP
jgi:hypothetical protein